MQRVVARVTAQQLMALGEAVEQLEQRIAQVMAVHPDAALFSELKGAGAALAPRLLTAFGTDRSKFNNAEEVACAVGVALSQNKVAMATLSFEGTLATNICSRPFMSSPVLRPNGAAGAKPSTQCGRLRE